MATNRGRATAALRRRTDAPARLAIAASREGEPEGRRIALLYRDPSLYRAFDAAARGAGIDLEAVALERFSRETWRPRPRFEAIVLEAGRRGTARRLLRWLRRSFPDTPLLLCGIPSPDGKAAGPHLHLAEPPTAASLPAQLVDARRHHEASRRAARLSTRLRETSRRLQILSDIVSTANSLLEPERVVAVIMSQIQKLIPSEAWSILLVDEERRELTFEMALGEKGEDVEQTRLKIGEGIAGWVAKTGEPAIVNDVNRDPRFLARFDQKTRFRTRSILCAPLVSRGRTIGVVEILNRAAGSRFTRRDLNLLLTLVEPAAIALENAILFQKTERLAVTDDLTRLYNSRYLNAFLERELSRSQRRGEPMSVVFLDLDGFKGINDRHGHLCGSQTLVEVGAILREAVREEDVVGRYGGDEFVLVLPGTDRAGAVAVAERVRARLKAHRFLAELGLSVGLSASFGVATFPEHGVTPQDLIQKADQAMYSVKERGKDGVGLAR